MSEKITKLKRFNVIMGFLHLIQGSALFWLGTVVNTDFVVPIPWQHKIVCAEFSVVILFLTVQKNHILYLMMQSELLVCRVLFLSVENTYAAEGHPLDGVGTSRRGSLDLVLIHTYAKTEVHSGYQRRRTVAHGACHQAFPADLRSSAILDS